MSYTAIQHPEAEKLLQDRLKQMVAFFRKQLPPEERQHILLAGSYGRGEGGVLIEKDQVQLHNNLDLVLIAKNKAAAQTLQQKIDELSRTLTEAHQIGIDLSTSWPWQIWRNRHQIFWHDTLHHHTQLDGSKAISTQLYGISPQPDLGQGLILVINRATLLLINALLLASVSTPQALSAKHLRLLKKHQIKATIGLSDAFFLLAGRYTPSYKARLKMLREEPHLLPLTALRERTIQAIEFRFRPSYEALSASQLAQENDLLIGLCREAIATYEQTRRHGNWEERSPQRGYTSVLRPSQRILSALKQGMQGRGLSNRNDRIVLSFLTECFRDPLHPEKLKDYLRLWGGLEDQNFSHFLARYQLAPMS
ncbi:MAG: hypothetical protein H6728_05905 [Myxococcales bacterium]|nr:hypothetical protein [Myxococcales bacterium]MCB9642592.1 hypothetical protein [Myxococcales bacterium]